MNKNIGKILKESRISSGISVKEISDILKKKGYKASESTIYSWENENSQPTPGAFLVMCGTYGIKNVLNTFGYNGYNEDGSIQLNIKEIDLIENYRDLDDPGRSHVDTILQWETDRMKQIEQTPAAIVELQNGSSEKGRLIDYYRSVSAGTGEVIFDDVYFERITLPDVPEYRRVAYAVKVDGRSMEPLYNDGDVLLIEPTCEVEVGEIGIFNIDGKAYVKKLGKEKLISLNKGYDDIPLTEDSLCMGRVVGKL